MCSTAGWATGSIDTEPIAKGKINLRRIPCLGRSGHFPGWQLFYGPGSPPRSRPSQDRYRGIPQRRAIFSWGRLSHRKGIQQSQPLAGSRMGPSELVRIPSDEISFSIPKHDELKIAGIDAILDSHPYEELVIIIQTGVCTRTT